MQLFFFFGFNFKDFVEVLLVCKMRLKFDIFFEVIPKTDCLNVKKENVVYLKLERKFR